MKVLSKMAQIINSIKGKNNYMNMTFGYFFEHEYIKNMHLFTKIILQCILMHLEYI
ncbi:hypothetical protein CAXC1_110021 [Candidatus Xenohaliotis californiensis]|uniref:Uncharacterized protein n=1 Tax=Candidatus Xenohaliotis californiensis TaxID=84677 RepID=A0ABP0ERQ8_9RICK|nr:hypothetical protein CAXC1_110021 [Candidatus Xenohaliotis californiensis]